jgi:hypothetical protein
MAKSMSRNCMFAAGIALLLAIPSLAQADDAADAARVDKLLKQAGLTFEKKNNTVWVIQQHGESLGDFREILALGDGLLVIFVTIARDADIPRSEELEYKMLKLNHELDRIKVEIDDDGDADVRADVTVRMLDTAEIKEQVHQVAASADQVYSDIKPFLAPQE